MSEIPYYTLDSNGNSMALSPNKEPYIDDDELAQLILEVLPDNISPEEIDEILKAASDKNLTEEEFDKIIDEFILKNRK